MMIKRKLRSEKGASITFALLIFLVCAVLSSVILVAATAASGVISKEAETDQRYYSVTSAAGLLKELLDDQSASIITIETSSVTTKYDSNGDPKSTSDNNDKVTKVYLDSVDEANLIDLDDQSEEISLVNYPLAPSSFTSIQQYAAYQGYIKSIGGSTESRQLKLNCKESGKDQAEAGLAATVNITVLPNGNLQLTVFNTNSNGSAGSQYNLVLTFEADVQSETGVVSEDTTNPAEADGSYSVTTENTKTTTTKTTWHLSSIKTLAA